MITSYGEESYVIEAAKHGASNFILKPFNNQKVMAIIKEVLEQE
jgi:FixJ family two-component response regulator